MAPDPARGLPLATRLAGRLASSPAFRAFGKHVQPRLDLAAHRLTGGRFRISSLGMPTLVLDHVGRSTGLTRRTPMMYVRDGEALLVVASNWGQENHPAWSGNLLANPEATVELGRRTVPVRARLLGGPEREAAWATVVRRWPAVETYAGQVTSRELRIFRLEPR
jgi:deazaflavin-dependent oxidoreductase (nitroreductase family)